MSLLQLQKAKLQILEAEKAIEEKKQKPRKVNELLLNKAIEEVSVCVNVIPEEERKIMEAVRRIESRKDKNWEVQVNYLLDQIEVMKDTYPIFADEAKRRRDLIDSINRTRGWEKEKELCAEDTLRWFNNWSWTSDPRKDGIGWALPFLPYEFQVDAIKWLEDLIFIERRSGLIEKSRDMGFSWVISSLLYKHWQHGDGSFQALVGSMTIDDTDVIGNPSTIFEKIRIQSRMQPVGLLPKKFDGDIPYCRAINPETGASIVGEPCNEKFGRSGRYKVIFFDELSAVTQDTEALTASSQSSPCKIYNSTVRGMGNEYAQIRFSGSVPVKTYHWTQHPYKSENWYQYQKLDMNSDTRVAQELDIDYTASTPNRVYHQYNEIYHVITKSEVMKALPSFRGRDGFQIPLGHNIAMGEDVGQTKEHAHVQLWFATLKEGTKTVDGVDLTGSVFCYREIIQPPHSPPRIWAESIKKAEGLYEPRMVTDRLISHEADTEIEVYWDEYKLDFTKWHSDYNGGISRIRDYLDIIDEDKPHPFRNTEQFKDAPPIMGRPYIYLVVDDEQGELLYEPATRRYHVTPAKDSGGLMRLRAEFPVYHYPTEELGKDVRKMRPKKSFDDAMDVIRCVGYEVFAPIKKMTDIEKADLYLENKYGKMSDIPPKDLPMVFLQREQDKKNYIKQQQQIGLSYRDRIWNRITS